MTSLTSHFLDATRLNGLLYFRKFVVLCMTESILFLTLCFILLSYILFFSNEKFDFLLAPFVTYIPVNIISRYVVKSVFMIFFFYLAPSWIFLQTMNHLLALIIRQQFHFLNDRFQRAIDDRGRLNDDLRLIRRRHHRVCMSVKLADSFIQISNVACFVCHGAIVIIVLFALLYCEAWDRFVNAMFGFFLIGNALCLFWTIFDSIIVNHEVGLNSAANEF